jgi:hypothetical protein
MNSLWSGNMDWSTLSPVLISTAVFAAAVGAIANVIVALMNNRRLKKIEKEKTMTEIQKYRYIQLYDMTKNWNSYGSKIEGDSISQLASNQLINRPLDNKGRWDIVKPLINPKFTDGIDEKVREVDALLLELVSTESEESDNVNSRQILSQYSSVGQELELLLKKAIYDQINELLLIDDK